MIRMKVAVFDTSRIYDAQLLRQIIKDGSIKKYRGSGLKTVNELRRLVRLPQVAGKPNPAVEALKRIDAYLSGVVEYEHGWLNHPAKPEMSPAKLLRDVIKRLS